MTSPDFRRRRVWSIFLLVALFFGFVQTAMADEFRVIDYGADDGLTVEFIKSVDQDTLGFIWVATDRGLFRYDGIRFTHFKDGLPSPYVKSFFHGLNGELYAVTDEGVVLIHQDSRHPSIEPFISGSTQLSDSALTYPKHGMTDGQGGFWITEQRGIAKFKEDRLQSYPFPEKDHAYDFLRAFTMLDAGVNGFYVLSLRGTLYRFNKRFERFDEYDLPQQLGQVSCAIPLTQDRFLVGASRGLFELLLPDKSGKARLKQLVTGLDISSMAMDDEGKVYFGTWAHGLYHVDPKRPEVSLQRIRDFQFIKVNALYFAQGNLWVSTDVGVSLVEKTPFTTISRSGLNTYIHDIDQGPNGEIFFCDGARIMSLASLERGAPIDTVYTEFDHTMLQFQFVRGSIYVSTLQGDILRVRNGRLAETLQLPSRGHPILSMIQDEEENLWLTQTDVPGLSRIDSKHEVTRYGGEMGLMHPVEAIRIVNGTLHAAFTRQDSLFVYRLQGEHFEAIVEQKLHSGMSQQIAYDLTGDAEGRLHVATSAGLYLVEDGNITPEKIELQPSTGVRAVTLHPDGDLWLGTRFNVVRMTDDGIVHYSVSDGLPARTISRHSIFIDDQGHVWMGTSLGAAYTRNINQSRPTPTPILLTTSLDGDPVEKLEKGMVHPTTLLEISFASLTYPGQFVHYQQRVVGREASPWRKIDGQRVAFLYDPPPGNVTWQIRAKRQGNLDWSDPLSIELEVLPHWYASWWAFILYGLLAIALYIIAIRLYTAGLIREKERLEHVIGTRTRQALDQLERSKNAELDAQQMRTANRIAGTIAHEFNNPLAIIQASLDLLRMKQLKGDDLQTFERIETQVVRMRDLVRKLLKLQGLREMDYAAGMKIVNIHNEKGEPEGKETSSNVKREKK
ncbi:hypothetical protein KQI63_12560 [bacterium]|nr:hypothetical protein [bacterium]